MATRSIFLSLRANLAITVPWNGSMKQTRNTNGRTLSLSFVTRGLVDEGVIIGVALPSATGAMASERLEATSPRSRFTLSFTTRRVAATAASSGFPWLS